MRRSFARVAGLIVLLMAASLALAPAVLAAAPSNDTYGGRTVIAPLPYDRVLDTSDATSGPKDVEANADCGAPALAATVWYSLRGTGTGVVVDVSASDYPAGVIVVTGSPGSFELVNCGPFSASFAAELGTTYSILVLDDQSDGGGNGGELRISVFAVALPSIDVTLNSVASFHNDGSATLSGLVACTGEFAGISVALSQRVGRIRISGEGETFDIVCDGKSHSWSADVESPSGLFKGGSATASVTGIACSVDCAFVEFEQSVNLKR